MTTRIVKFIVLSLFLSIIFSSCSKTEFCGKVIDRSGNGISEASVSIGKTTAVTDNGGKFSIKTKTQKNNPRYVLNIKKKGFLSTSKVYTDSACDVTITLSKATVVTADPNQDIVVTDTNPEMSIPASTTAPVTSPLDTLPLVFNSQGKLIGFGTPPELRNVRDAVAQFQPQRLGARVRIPAQSLVMQGSQNPPSGNVDVSVGTIDLFAEDGMPGDNTVNFGDDDSGARRLGAMISFGAANIEVSINGQPVNLGSGKSATLEIPVDTLSILGKVDLPKEIPFLVFNESTGFWDREGTAELNQERTAYVKEVTHFSTFNMDMIWMNQSCIQICDGTNTAAGRDLEITVDSKTKTYSLPGTDICSGGVSDCDFYGIDVGETHAIKNLLNNIPVSINVIENSTSNVLSSYVFYSGDAPGGDPLVYQDCNYNDCAGPFYIGDVNPCWESELPDGTLCTPTNPGEMCAPIVAAEFDEATNTIDVSWVFIQKINTTTNQIDNDPFYYRLEYIVTDATADYSTLSWTRADFDPAALVDEPTYPAVSASATTDWKIETTLDFPDASGTNPDVDPAVDIILLRVGYGPTASSNAADFTFGYAYVRNLGGAFSGTFTSAENCYTE